MRSTLVLPGGAVNSSADPYARIADLDEQTVATLADRIETRAADPRQQRLWADFLSRAQFPAGARVLEVGCGTGVITALVADLPGVEEVVGVDPSPHFVDRARHRAPRLSFEVADGRALPYDEASFDGVVIATTLCHVPGPDLVLAEARRVLRPGGVLLLYDGDYVTTTVAIHPLDPLQRCVEAAIGRLVHDPWLVRRLRGLVSAAGFDTEELVGHGHLATEEPTYALGLVDLGADTLVDARCLDRGTGDALKVEARDRVAGGRFFCHIGYASLRATLPRTDSVSG